MSHLIRTKLHQLILLDPCDRCPARGRLAVLVGDKNGIPLGPLVFCKHHGDQHEIGLFSKVKILDVIDERATFGVNIKRQSDSYLD